jgi:BNR/Asp-box repeat
MVDADGRLQLDFGEERMVLDGGLQPSMLCTASGTLIVQAQLPDKPVPTPRMHYPSAVATVVSRDGGKTWSRVPLPPDENGVNLEGGVLQLRDGTILALDTYITPGARSGEGIGQLYTSTDEWRTIQGPRDVPFELPGIDFYASSDDGGRPHPAERLHRRIIELPNGHLLTTLYGTMQGDKTPSTYKSTMMKSRVMLARSIDRGRHWKLVSTVAVDPRVGTEGFDEPVLARLSGPEHAGRLICFMRTGRELYEAVSDNEGASWTPPQPRVFGGLDIHRTELWVDMFRKVRGRTGRLLDENNPDELKGSVVDPDLIELRSGLLAAVFGVRVPQQLCWPNYQHPWNGNYLAFSHDGGKTWSNVVRMTSGVPTTHYMAVEQTPADNELFVSYDFGFWNYPKRYIYGRSVKITIKAREPKRSVTQL